MSDNLDEALEEGETPEQSAAPKKKKGGGLKAIIPTILKFAAIGLGALIFIVTVAVITYNIMNSGGKSQTTVADPSSPYIGSRPIFSWYTEIGSVTTRTRDTSPPYAVTVVIHIGYDQNDAAAASELNGRRSELQEFIRRYFAGKFATELQTEHERRLKQEIIEQLNTRYLDTAKIREIAFIQLDIMEVF